jgi:hypothetical protein
MIDLFSFFSMSVALENSSHHPFETFINEALAGWWEVTGVTLYYLQ